MYYTSRLRLELLAICVLALLLPAGTQADDCSVEPISLPWANITLDGIAANRGIAGLFGNQILALRGTTILNNTRVRNKRDCEFGNQTAQAGCTGASGSAFDTDSSPTWTAALQGDWNVTAFDSHDPDETIYEGWETVKFFGLDPIPGLPLEVWSNMESDNKSGLALGTSSSFLNTLLFNHVIPSINWGLFFGSRSQTRGVDGNLTLGGYDKARVAGEFTSYPISPGYLESPCPLQVQVADIVLRNANGNFSLLADPESTVAFCIDSLQNQLSLTPSQYATWANLTQHPTDPSSAGGTNFTEQTYPLENEPLMGDLTITLSNGFQTVIPHYELVSQERGTDLEGKYAVVNESRIMAAVGTSTDSINSPVLGGVYLSQVYLFVNSSENRFYLSNAVIGALGDDEHEIVKVCTAESNSSGTNAGPIAGGVVGGVIGVGLIAVGLWWLRRRRSKKDTSTQQKEPKQISWKNAPIFNDKTSEPDAAQHRSHFEADMKEATKSINQVHELPMNKSSANRENAHEMA